MSKLLLRDVRKAYGATVALASGNLELAAGEVHVLIGSNGSGKSTLCKIVAGSVRPDGGEVILDDRPVEISGPQVARDLGIGIFYQELSLAAHKTVAENISLGRMPVAGGLFVDRRKMDEIAEKYIAPFRDVVGEGFSADIEVGRLRADQRQLVEIMKTLATEADILIFDEPTSALDRAQVDRFFGELKRLRDEGRSIVFISHRMDEIFAIGDRVTVIRDGRTVATETISDTSHDAIIAAMVGGKPEVPGEADQPAQAAQPASSAGAPVLAVENLAGDGFAEIGFTLRQGEILGFGGLHGQGQSAVLRALFGTDRTMTGTVTLDGETVTLASPRRAIRQGFAYISGDRGRDGAITGRPILENVTPIHFVKNRVPLALPGRLEQKVGPALASLKTKFATLMHPISSLSGGNQQKVIIARWLVDRPRILLLDDPTKGIDLQTKTELFALIRELAAEGMAILLYSSEDAELLGNAGRILVFNNGRISRTLEGDARTRYNLYQAAYKAAS